MKIKSVDSHEDGTGEITMEYAEKVFKELLAFQGYGFCLGYDVPVIERMKGVVSIGRIEPGDSVLTPGDEWGEKWAPVKSVMPQGRKEVYEIGFSNDRCFNATLDHPLLCEDGIVRNAAQILDMYSSGNQCKVMFRDNCPERISYIRFIGMMPVMDIEVDSKAHLFYANGCIVHNCKAHATSYSVYSAVQMYLQEHFFVEYMCALLNHIDRAKEKKGHQILDERVEYCIRDGVGVLYPNVNSSMGGWTIVNNGATLLAPLSNIKGFSDSDTETIVSHRPYADLNDFVEKTGISTSKFETLLFSRALSDFGSINDIYNGWYLDHTDADGSSKRKWSKKKPAGTAWGGFDLFGGEGVEVSESSSSEAMNRVEFSQTELDDRCLDMNGFVIKENIRMKYQDVFSKRMRDFLEGDDAEGAVGKSVIHSLDEIAGMERTDNSKAAWFLAQVQSVTEGLKTKKSGADFTRAMLGDGRDSITVFIWERHAPQWCRKGNVALVPLKIVTQEDGQNKVSYASWTAKDVGVPLLHEEK